MALLFGILLLVPLIIYAQFLEADREKQSLLLQSVQEQGRLTGQALLPLLSSPAGDLPTERLDGKLKSLAGPFANVKILFRPSGSTGQAGYYFVASSPQVSTAQLAEEREKLIEQGVLQRLSESCSGDEQLAVRFSTERGGEAILTSITPVNTGQGCWVVLTSHSTAAFLGEAIGQPYWNRPEVRIAAFIYLAMVVISLTIFIALWRNVHRFGKLARSIGVEGRGGRSFSDLNRVPELDPVAKDFDRLVAALQESGHNIRRAAEENAHALKTPIAIIRQCLEPLKRGGSDNERAERAVDMIEKSVDRLDALVSSAKKLDEAAADLLTPPRNEIDLSSLLHHILAGYGEILSDRDLMLDLEIQDGIYVLGGNDLLETVLENILDNAISFSPPGARLFVSLRRTIQGNELSIEDEGPGVSPENLERIFDRYYSNRPDQQSDIAAIEDPDNQHFGIGMWIVQRNIAAIGGAIEAENRTEGGLRIRIIFPTI